jgi:hypothetical protein
VALGMLFQQTEYWTHTRAATASISLPGKRRAPSRWHWLADPSDVHAPRRAAIRSTAIALRTAF